MTCRELHRSISDADLCRPEDGRDCLWIPCSEGTHKIHKSFSLAAPCSSLPVRGGGGGEAALSKYPSLGRSVTVSKGSLICKVTYGMHAQTADIENNLLMISGFRQVYEWSDGWERAGDFNSNFRDQVGRRGQDFDRYMSGQIGGRSWGI